MRGLDDDSLVDLFRGGAADAFEALFARYHRMVFNYAFLMTGDRQAAEDILQDTFIAAARSVPRYEPAGRFRAWLMAICRNRCLALLERFRTRRRLMDESGFELLTPSISSVRAHESLARREELDRLRVHLQELPEASRDALSLYAFDDLSYAEIAQVLGCPINTVKTLIRRARIALAHQLAADHEDLP
ncbi:MAG: RNA polymerase sigma factor [Lentisphaerae bacterium]|jgi:RNA polymerase sigma-70 factor, ECF subfamily|nr:RNA polymerase sigma factor [Lentisphaerota bacterium]MBT4814650.1 RNA polymerase sigma factor [Lentisphaerota bacterium]MBT5609589.1 RNA polymerase sigma factor [Lentisphaerota bacterium]MBT7057785.1 RNA polymerase sigma factor [Lentisphaerota bacterium]MBT7843204.1 RNA polymerase sigma factor [Lentisphaerota bacterium]